jgi:hypothetical protein
VTHSLKHSKRSVEFEFDCIGSSFVTHLGKTLLKDSSELASGSPRPKLDLLR